MEQFIKNDKRVINGWAMFDWANSAYFLVISTAIFPVYYVAVTNDTIPLFGREISNSSFFSYSVSLAYVIIAILTPILSGMADYGGRRIRFLRVFTWIGGLACIGLGFFATADMIYWGTLLFIIATIGAAGGIVFYNALLPLIVTEDKYDEVSAKGYAYGYVGSVLLLAFCLVMINMPETFGFADASTPTRLSFVLVGVWWIGFAHITFARMPPDSPQKVKGMVRKGVKELLGVWKKVRVEKPIIRFLGSVLFFMAGVQTVIYLASIFASEELQMETAELILVILILQIVAILGALLFARLSKIWGNKMTLVVQITIWMLICLGAYFVATKMQFYVLAGFVGLVLGGIQSLSRSTYAKLIEEGTSEVASYFSFYDVLMKISLVAGSFIFGFVAMVTGSMRGSILALMFLFAIGLLILLTVKSNKITAKGS